MRARSPHRSPQPDEHFDGGGGRVAPAPYLLRVRARARERSSSARAAATIPASRPQVSYRDRGGGVAAPVCLLLRNSEPGERTPTRIVGDHLAALMNAAVRDSCQTHVRSGDTPSICACARVRARNQRLRLPGHHPTEAPPRRPRSRGWGRGSLAPLSLTRARACARGTSAYGCLANPGRTALTQSGEGARRANPHACLGHRWSRLMRRCIRVSAIVIGDRLSVPGRAQRCSRQRGESRCQGRVGFFASRVYCRCLRC